MSHTDWCAYPNCLGTCNCGVTDAATCGITSLKGYPCVKPPHPFTEDHERWDGRTWPHGQTWGDVIVEYCRREGIDPDGG